MDGPQCSLQLGLQAQTPLCREECPGVGTQGSPVPCRVFLRVLQRAPFTDVQLEELLSWEAPAPVLEGALSIHTLLSTGQEWKSEAGVEDKAKCR